MPDDNTLPEAERLKAENAHLRAQLDQALEELQFYFQKYQDLSHAQPSMQGTKASDSGEKSEGTNSPVSGNAEIVLDMAHFIDGENWYKPEQGGRWAGPQQASTIHIPALAAGRYSLNIAVSNSMAPDIFRQLEVSFDGRKISIQKILCAHLTGTLAPLRRLKASILNAENAYPALVKGQVVIDDAKIRKKHTLKLAFPRTLSPTATGDTDSRQLALRFTEIRLRREGAA